MTKVYLKYNPYIVESEIKIDDVLVETPNKLADFVNERLQVWVEELMPVLNEICNDDEYTIEFYGTSLDYADLQLCVNEYCEGYSDVKVTLNFIESKGASDRFNELVDLFNEMQRTCPFEDLKTEQIRENFQSAISSEFEVSVIATMSSGKSTVINSLLGRELMPSKNEACTATIARIKDVDDMDRFEAVYQDRERRELGRFEDLTLASMTEMNENPETAYINITGNIPNIDSNGVQLVLVDTPGPNNSRTEDHKNHTYRIIKEKTKPMVLYVLNATQLQTNDDRELLSAVSDAMKVGGRQSKDRFLFAVNKIDLFDPDKESVQGALDNVREYLKKFDIENPNLFPTSAELAKVIRMSKHGQNLTTAQKRTLRDYDFFINEEKLHLSEQATLSKDNAHRIQEMLTVARAEKDRVDEALIHTGVPAIELAINEYLRKYAYTAKVKAAVDTFRKKVEEKDMKAKLMSSIADNEVERQRINTQLIELGKLLKEGEAAEEFRQKIRNLDMTKEANTRIAKLRKKVSSSLVNTNGSNESITTLQAQQLMMKLDGTVRALQSDIKTELENIISDTIIDNAQAVMKEYQAHMYNLINEGGLQTSDYEGNINLNFLAEDLPDAQELIDRYKSEEEYDTGKTEWVENTNKKWYKPWTWFQESGYIRHIYAKREMVDYGTLFNDFIQPVIANFMENIDGAKQVASDEATKFRDYFMGEIDKLEIKFKEKVAENEQLTRNQESIENLLDEQKLNMEWLKKFMKKLDQILAI